MSPRTVLITALLTALAVIAAAVAVISRPMPTAVALDAEPAFAALRDAVETVATIEIRGGAGAVTVERAADGTWTVAEKGGYPAKAEAVQGLVLGLAGLRLVEAKTDRPDRYGRLDVEDIGAGSGAARQVRLLGGDGTVLADAIIGRRVYSATGGESAGTYLRRSGEARAWLAGGGVTVAASPVDWLDASVIDIAADQVRRVAVRRSGEAAYTAARAEGATGLGLTALPEGRTPRPAAVDRLARMLERVVLTDVAPAGTVEGAVATAEVEVETLDGRIVRIGLATDGTERWATVSVDAAAAADSAVAGAAPAAADGEGTGDTAAPAPAPAPARKLDGWSYRLAASVADRLAPPLEDLLEPLTPAGGS